MLPFRHAPEEWNTCLARVLTCAKRKPSCPLIVNHQRVALMNCTGIVITAARFTPSGVQPAAPAREVDAH